MTPPGKSPAAPNSRSVIVGHKPQIPDDQFVAAAASSGSSGSSDGGSHDAGRKREDESGAGHAAGVKTRLAEDPSEKRALLDSRKKIELKPAAGDTPPVPKQGNGKEGEAAVSAAPSAPAVTTVASASAPATTEGQEHHADLTAVTSEHLADLAIEQVVETDTFAQPGTGAGEGASEPAGLAASAAPPDGNDGAAPVAPSEGGGVGGVGPSDSEKHAASGAAAGADAASASTDAATDTNTGARGANAASDDPKLPRTVDDLLAETGAPDLAPQKAIVSTHHRHGGAGKLLFIILLLLILAAAGLNFLLDAGVIEVGVDVPFTDLIRD